MMALNTEKKSECQNLKEVLFRQRKSRQIISGPDFSLSYQQWYRAAQRLAERLATHFITGSKIGLYLPNSVAFAVAYFGTLLADMVVVPFNPDQSHLELVREINFCDVCALITNQEYYSGTLDIFFDLTQVKRIFVLVYEDFDSKEVFSENFRIDENFHPGSNKSEPEKISPNQVCVLLPTSGTTMRPRRVMLSHRNLISNLLAHQKSVGIEKKSSVLISLPMFFGYCHTSQFLLHTYLGGKIVIMGRMFFPGLFFELVEKEKIQSFTAVPTMLKLLIEYNERRKHDMSSLKYLFFGGSLIDDHTIADLEKRLPDTEMIQTYGLTEASPRVTTLRANMAVIKGGSVGKAIPGVSCRIVNPSGKTLQPEEEGEIVVEGENVMLGYYKNRPETNKILKKNSLYTGDIGILDKDGFLYLRGRKKNLIISGGINIRPEEIEEYIASHPSVKSVMIIGMEDRLLGEIPVSKVILKKGCSLTASELYHYCRQGLAGYKIPKKFYFVKKIDLTYSGKIKRY